MPSVPNPSDIIQNQPVNTQLSWTSSDPENDPLTYDVYFGAYNLPVLVSSGQTGKNYNPGTLAYNTSYSWKIVAHDNHSHSTEGPVWSFTTASSQSFPCGNPLLDTRDNQTYTTVQIGAQCWMAEDLNIGTMIPGANEMANNSIIEKYCYNNSAATCDVYGGLYQWNEMMQYVNAPGVQGICPAGWHLPADAEWCTLTQFIDPTVNCNTVGWSGTDAGTKMKSTTSWIGGVGSNTSGFTGLPSGFRASNGTFNWGGARGYFWYSTEYLSTNAWLLYLDLYSTTIIRVNTTKGQGYSVRCLAD